MQLACIQLSINTNVHILRRQIKHSVTPMGSIPSGARQFFVHEKECEERK